ncbi:Rossmann-fold NAD(P)-binding domain-containing protein [Paracoccus beibuensis]|uniref:hypothetical protein n=1 Tax=Paracoccus beibuensis TaxID=547602 RepID=UPI00223ED9B3|nr:hypothetical protein [Paracoccus beibuensis]
MPTADKLGDVVAAATLERRRVAVAVADATDEAQVIVLFEMAEVVSGRIIDLGAAYLDSCWRLACFGGFPCAQEAVQRMGAAATSTGRAA